MREATKGSAFASPSRGLFATVAAALLLVLVTPHMGVAFRQVTSVEGTLGNDIGGIYLVLHNVMPEFRIRYKRDAQTRGGVMPFQVAPISAELIDFMGPKPSGVQISEITDHAWASARSVFEGDVIIQVNTMPVSDEKSFAEAAAKVAGHVTLWIRRPQIKFTTGRLVKISYSVVEDESAEASAIAEERINLEISDATLPFVAQLENSRRTSEIWKPSDEELAELRAGWSELPMAEKPIFITGTHRVVAAAAYDVALLNDRNLGDTVFAIVSDLKGNPVAGTGGQVVAVYGAQEISPEGISGSYVEALIAAAPFPISIEFKGRFTMIRLADFSDKDIDHRLADFRAARKKAAEDDKKVKVATDLPDND